MVYNLLPSNIDRILDIACQTGECTEHLLNKSKYVVGLDLQGSFLSEAKNKRKSELRFINARAEELPFKEKIFDYCILIDMLECVSNPSKCINEAHRVLKPTGKVIVSIPQRGLFYFLNPDNFKFYLPSIYRKIYYILRRKEPSKQIRFSKESDYHPQYSLKDIHSLLNLKFKICRVYQGGLMIYPISICMNYFFNVFHLNKHLLKIINYISNIEYRINFGRLAYHLLVIAEKSR